MKDNTFFKKKKHMPEIIDLYNNARKIIKSADKEQPIPNGLNKLSVHVWIVNKQGQFLLQQRVNSAKKFPNMWGPTGGTAQTGEDSWQCCVRETYEELGIKPDFKKSVWIGTFKRTSGFVDVWVTFSDVKITDLKLQPDEVQDAKWVSKSQLKDMIDNGIFVTSVLPGLEMVYTYFALKRCF